MLPYLYLNLVDLNFYTVASTLQVASDYTSHDLGA